MTTTGTKIRDPGMKSLISTASSLGATIAIWGADDAEATSLKGARIRFTVADATYQCYRPDLKRKRVVSGSLSRVSDEVTWAMTRGRPG